MSGFTPGSGWLTEQHPEVESCARCGRALRGAWDRNKTEAGLICHICANQAVPGQGPEPVKPIPRPAPKDHGIADPFARVGWVVQSPPISMPPKKKTKARIPYENPALEWIYEHRSPMIILGAAVAAIIVIIVLPVEEYAAALFAVDMEKAEALPGNWHFVLKGVDLLLQMVENTVWLFLGLHLIKKLPNETWAKNVIAVGAVAVFFALLPAFGLFLGVILGFGEFGFVLGAGSGILFYFAIYSLYDLSFGDIITLLFLGLFLNPCFWAMEQLTYGLLAAIVL